MTFGCSVIFVVVFYTARSKQQYERLALAETDDRRCSLLHITRDVYERVFACVCKCFGLFVWAYGLEQLRFSARRHAPLITVV